MALTNRPPIGVSDKDTALTRRTSNTSSPIKRIWAQIMGIQKVNTAIHPVTAIVEVEDMRVADPIVAIIESTHSGGSNFSRSFATI